MKTSSPNHEEIAQLAHQIFVRNGSQHGAALDHWLEAEAELGQQKATAEKKAPENKPAEKAAPEKAASESKKPVTPASATKGKPAAKKAAKSSK